MKVVASKGFFNKYMNAMISKGEEFEASLKEKEELEKEGFIEKAKEEKKEKEK